MSSRSPRLVLPAGLLPDAKDRIDLLRSAFEVVEVESAAEARRLAQAGDVLLLGADEPLRTVLPDDLPAGGAMSVLEHIGQGVGIVDAAGALTWSNRRLRDLDDDTQARFAETCHDALLTFNQSGEAAVPLTERPGRKYAFTVGDSSFEVAVSIADVSESDQRNVEAVVGMLWNISTAHDLQARLDAIDAAGAELLRIDTDAVVRLDMAERLRQLEAKIREAINDLLEIENFEVRLIDRETKQLELVFSSGLAPLRIGEVMYAEEHDNGISGYVAATGESYLCRDAATDAHYHEGLHDAASSITVPLQLHDRVIGVLNAESNVRDAFDEHDLMFAQILGRYIAMAMHILDLLVVERYTTNKNVATSIRSELSAPIEALDREARAMLARRELDPASRAAVDGMLETIATMRGRLDACTTGPRSLIGAEQALHPHETDPLLKGKRVILADNEAVVRDAIGALLRGKGCEVAICSGGAETIDLLRDREARHEPVDLVISDIRMPDRNGYEVFRTAKEYFAETPVILMTGFGYDPHHSIVRASQEGLHSFLFKPLQATQLLEAIAKAFE